MMSDFNGPLKGNEPKEPDAVRAMFESWQDARAKLVAIEAVGEQDSETDGGTVNEPEIVKGSGRVRHDGRLIRYIDGQVEPYRDDEQIIKVVLLREGDYLRLLRAARQSESVAEKINRGLDTTRKVAANLTEVLKRKQT